MIQTPVFANSGASATGLPGSGVARPPFTFSLDDQALLDQVQRGAWNWAMDSANPRSFMVPDRSSRPYISTAGVGFQLAAFPVAVERGLISRAEAERRVLVILTMLANAKTTQKFGMFQHFVDGDTAEMAVGAYEDVVSTIDSGLLLAGCLVASSYFGGEIARVADAMVSRADWAAFIDAGAPRPFERGFISLGWKPNDRVNAPAGEGTFLQFYWHDSGCEHRLCSFLAVAAPDPAKRADPRMYYSLRRQIGTDGALGPKGSDESRVIYFPWSGALFVNQFSHVFLNYAAMGPDDPAAAGVPSRARVDWWENARRMTNLHRARAIELSKRNPASGFGPNAWGFTASDCTTGYQVAGCFPELDENAMAGSRLLHDFSWYRPHAGSTPPGTDPGDGSIAPYAAGMSIMFEPRAAVDALRHYRGLAATNLGLAKLWQDPSSGGHGFADAYNVKPPKGGATPWVAPDHLAIDQLPMLLAIENARSGLVWRLFHQHRFVQQGMSRLGLNLQSQTEASPAAR